MRLWLILGLVGLGLLGLVLWMRARNATSTSSNGLTYFPGVNGGPGSTLVPDHTGGLGSSVIPTVTPDTPPRNPEPSTITIMGDGRSTSGGLAPPSPPTVGGTWAPEAGSAPTGAPPRPPSPGPAYVWSDTLGWYIPQTRTGSGHF